MRPVVIKRTDYSRRTGPADGNNPNAFGYPPSADDEEYIITDDLSDVINEVQAFVITDLSAVESMFLLTLNGDYIEDNSSNLLIQS